MFRTYVASVLSGCCIRFHTYVANVSSKCCICFALMLQVFYPDVAYVFTHMLQNVSSKCCICFAMATHVFPLRFRRMLQVFQLFQRYVTSVFNCFGRMLQMFSLDVAKVDLVL
jgi:hypothetical protein